MSKSNDHATTDRFSESAHESVDQIAKSAGKAEERIRHEAEDAKEYVRDAKQKTKQRSDEAMNTVSLFVQRSCRLVVFAVEVSAVTRITGEECGLSIKQDVLCTINACVQ